MAVDVTLDVETFACVQHERGEPCGMTWYQVTAHGHTVGVCAAKGRKFVGRSRTDKQTGQITVELVDGSDEVAAAIGFTPPVERHA